MISYAPLWKILVNKDMTKTQLREKVGFSTVTLAKLSKNEYVSLQIIDDICKILNVNSISEVVEYIPEKEMIESETYLLTLEKTANELIKESEDSYGVGHHFNKFILYTYLKKFISDPLNIKSENDINKFIDIVNNCQDNKLLSDELIDDIYKAGVKAFEENK